MLRTILTVAALLASFAPFDYIVAEGLKKHTPTAELKDLKNRPDLAIDYRAIARFKLASRKRNYRAGELVSLDVAIINLAKIPVFIHKPFFSSLVLSAVDENGIPVLIDSYSIGFEALSPASYQQTEAGQLIVESFLLLTSCTSDLAAFLEKRRFGADVFDRDLFVNWGQACLGFKSPGKYTITATESNDKVVVLSGDRKIKTAVGTMRSTPLTVTITE